MANIIEEFEAEQKDCQRFANQINGCAYLIGPGRGKAVKNLLNIVSAEGFSPRGSIQIFYAAWPKEKDE